MSKKQLKQEESTNGNDRTIQYTFRGNAYVRCGQTALTVPAGFYDVVDTGYGNYGLEPKVMQTDELIDLPGTVADEIHDDIGKFMANSEDYAAYGLTHKRGYLFYGPPGSGKTSLAMMLARRFVNQVGGVVMYCGDVGSFYHGVSIMRDVEPGRPSMYLIEEADTIVNNTHCLGILDGELSIQGAVFIAMTNYKDRLPPRIANRPGRFDRVTYVDCPPPQVQLEYLRRVEARGGKNPQAPERIVKALTGLPMSMAHLREAFISHVLMGMTLPEVRVRFEIMAGIRDDKGNLRAIAPAQPDADDDDGNDDDWKRQERIEDAKAWEPEA